MRLLLPAVASLILVGLDATATLAQSDVPADKPARHCFSLTRWNGGWRAAANDVLYLGIDHSDVYRLDLNGSNDQLLMADAHLINIVRGGDMVCTPIDLDLFVSDGHGFKTPLFVKTITKLTPEEVAALPKTLHP